MLISGKATVTDDSGNTSQTDGAMFAMCRCGQSGNKPFCDGSHEAAGFEAGEFVIEVPVVEK